MPIQNETEKHPPLADREEIARLAYEYWQERGCPEGSAEDDWLRAEAELRANTSKAAA
jgi:Protein of unknown function (DUF2934)